MDGQQGAGLSKKERGNEAVRQFRKRQKEKEQADKEKAERLRKENLELESKVSSFMTSAMGPESGRALPEPDRALPVPGQAISGPGLGWDRASPCRACLGRALPSTGRAWVGAWTGSGLGPGMSCRPLGNVINRSAHSFGPGNRKKKEQHCALSNDQGGGEE